MSSAVSTVVRPTLYLPSPAHSRFYTARKHIPPPPLTLKKVQEVSLANEAALRKGGLRTPPAEVSMSTTYQHKNPVLSSTYDNHVTLARQPHGSVAQVTRTGEVPGEVALNQMSRSQPQQQAQYQHRPQQYTSQAIHHVPAVAPNPQPHSASSRHSTRSSTPSSTATSHAHSEGTISRRESTMVMHSLRLPSCISSNGGNLDDFAALMTCFFWFEDMETIHVAERIKDRRSHSPIPSLTKSTRPSLDYKKWVTTILSTTQVTQNVILLALLFVYRLKSTNPKVNGHIGSEYRLLTVALMLGNKFLDDNTYTNKTWAEVSGISVKEMHVMEVEFLSNMRYGLLTSKDQWAEWLQKLACFHEYCQRAEATERAELELAARQQQQAMALNVVSSPDQRGFSSPLPSPTILPSSMQGTPSSLTAYSPNSAVYNANQSWQGQYQPTPTVSPLAAKPNLSFPNGSRKRSLEGSELAEPAPKRTNRQTPVALPPAATRQAPPPAESVRLPFPHLTLNTSQTPAPPAAYPPANNAQLYRAQAPVSLPPLGAGVRAMSTVYSTATTWVQQGPLAATCGPQTPSFNASSNYGTPSKRHSPGILGVYGSSPLQPFSTHTPMSNSPSVYLQQRNSPYKPVRPVNTLNYPPPSMPLSEYHMGSAQMHYQPIGRRNVHTGVVPEFLLYASGRPTPAPVTQAQHYRQ